MRAYNLPEEFPEAVTEQLKRIPDQSLPEELAGRKDLRELQTVTIDEGREAKDLDDAITIKNAGRI